MKKTQKKDNEKKIIILISIIGIVLVCLVIFKISNVIVSNKFNEILSNSIASDRVYFFAEGRSSPDKEEVKNKEFSLEPPMYYAKNGNGYDISVANFAVFDNVAYFEEEDGKAVILSEDSVSEYNAYFKDFSKDAFLPDDEINIVKILPSMQKYKPIFASKSTKNGVTEYRLNYGVSFYADFIRQRYHKIYSPWTSTVLVKEMDGKIASVELKFKLFRVETYFYPNGGVNVTNSANFFYEYKFNFDYEKVLTPTERQQNFDYIFYKNAVPSETYELTDNTQTISNGVFYGGRFYFFDQDYHIGSRSDALYYFDFGSGEKTHVVKFPTAKTASDMIVIDGALYFSIKSEKQIWKYDISSETVSKFNVDDSDMKVVGKVGDKLLVQSGIKTVYTTSDFSLLTRAEQYEGYKGMYDSLNLKYANGNLYGEKVFGVLENKNIVKITDSGELANKIVIGYNDYWYTNSKGIVVCVYRENDLPIFKQYDWNMNLIKTYDDIKHRGDFYEETEDYLFFNGYIQDKRTNQLYKLNNNVSDIFNLNEGVFYWAEYYHEIYTSNNLNFERIEK